MTDPLPDTTAGLPDAVPDPPDTEPLLTAQEAATLLGVSERTIRRRINAGELPSAKVAGQYRIPASAVGQVSVASAGRAGHPAGHADAMTGAAGQGAGYAGQVPDTPVLPDIEPLAALIGDLSRENRQLAEAAAVWQFRALQAEDRLKALNAGEPAQDAPISSSAPPGAAEEQDSPPDTSSSTASSIRSWWRRLWGGS